MLNAKTVIGRRQFCKTLLSVPLFAGYASLRAAPSKRLNVLLITVDDMNYNSIGAYGCAVRDITPHIDRLASEGMRFTHAHVNTAICQPSRQSMLTGRYAHRHSLGGFTPIFDNVPTLTEKLHEAGYLNGILCKVSHYAPKAKFFWDFDTDGKDMLEGRSPKLFYENTLNFIKTAQSQNKPFFLSANSRDPHRPYSGSEQEKRLIKKTNLSFPVSRVIEQKEVSVPGFLPDLPDVHKEIAQYYTSCHRGDESVGAILQALQDAGEADRTLVIFLSDNGISVPFAKTNCYLNSTRTPLIVRWPGHVKSGTVNDALVSEIDFTPTILEAVGLEPLAGVDGHSLVGLLEGKTKKVNPYVFTELHETAAKNRYPMRAVQDGRYGYIVNFWSDGKTVFKNESQSGLTFKAMQEAAKTDANIAARVKLFQYRVPEEFYDFGKDPDGLHNCIDLPEYQSEIKRLTGALEKHLYDSDDPAAEAFTHRHDPKAVQKFMEAQRKLAGKEKQKSKAASKKKS